MRERPTLVMLHGGPGLDHSPFKQPHFSPLGEVAQVLFYDHRGNGRSDLGTADQWTLDTWADDVVRLCDALGIEKPIVFGASFGGFVALNYAIRHPDHPARLILSSTAAHIDLDRAFIMFERLGGVEARDAAQGFFSNPTEESFAEYRRVCLPLYTQRAQHPDVLTRIARNIEVMAHFQQSGEMLFDYRNQLSKIRCPTLVMAGALDPIVTIDTARELAQALPAKTTQFREFPDAGHMLALEKPAEVISHITMFIGQN
jgi:proline iminopeptidase